jgi:hypothetical protein
MASDDFDLIAFEQGLRRTLQDGEAAFNGIYKRQLNDLAGLSRAEIDAIVPGTTDLATYDKLITVVKEASRGNLAQAQLKSQILKLGDLAVAIAQRVPSVAGLLA